MSRVAPPAEPERAAALPQGPRWRVRLLGDVAAAQGERSITRWPSRAVAALLATLALEPDRAHAREQLVERLWPGAAPEVGRNRLRQALSTLRALLEPAAMPGAPVLIADRSAVRVAPGALACDVQQFEQCARNGLLEQAQAWYRGELMPGFYDEWVLTERARLETIQARVATVRPGSSRTAATMPAPPAAAPAPGPAGLPTMVELPHYLTRLFGTQPTARRLHALLAAQRLVTIVGPGGVGKTRLAVEVAHALARPDAPAELPTPPGPPRFDRIAFVPLVACSSRAQLLDALRGSLRAGGEGTAFERVESALRGRRTLLVLDNFEQLVDDGADTLAELLAQVPGLHLLVSSRRALGVDGETLFELGPLVLPPADAALAEAAGNAAVALFVDRAQAVRADFHLGPRNRDAVLALVHRLEGLPLAVELAASRVRSLSPGEMLAMLSGPPAAGAELLARRGPRAAQDPRHASMQSVVAWSWSLLGEAPRALLEALVPFDGGCSASAAASVTGTDEAQAVQRLDELVGHSLLRTRSTASGRTRFFPYEPVHEFAAARLSRAKALRWRARHRACVLAWARALPATPPLPEVRDEWGNVAAALASAVADGDPAAAIELLLQLRRVVEDVGLPDAALDQLLHAARDCDDVALTARGRSVLAPALLRAGRGGEALKQAQRAVAALPAGAPARPMALHALARVVWRSRRDAGTVLPLLDEADAACSGDDQLEQQAALAALRAFVTNQHLRDPQAARALHERALALWQRSGNRHAVHSGQYNLAVTDQNQGLNRETLTRLQPLIDEARAQQDWRRLSEAHNVAGNALIGLRRWADAAQAFGEALRVAWTHCSAYELAYPLWNLPHALAHLRRPEAAARLMAFAAHFWTEGFGPLGERDRLDQRRVRRLAGAQIGAAAVADAWRDGEALTPAAAVASALRESG